MVVLDVVMSKVPGTPVPVHVLVVDVALLITKPLPNAWVRLAKVRAFCRELLVTVMVMLTVVPTGTGFVLDVPDAKEVLMERGLYMVQE